LKVISLIEKAKMVIDFWSGKTKKGTRTIGVSQTKLNEASIFDAAIIEKKSRKRIFRFLFIVLDKGKVRK